MALGDQAVQGAGRILAGRYRLVSVVGRGGMGTVWRAVDEVLHRDVAIKEVQLTDSAGDAERESRHERTLREARATARLNHPGVVTVHDVVDEDDRPWIVMELVAARSLQEIIDADGSLPPERVAEIGRQVVGALSAAHAIGIMHRDVKPANVLLASDGRAVLTDFGIAHIAGDATLTSTGGLLGSPAYMSPQRINGERATPAADMWGLGATLYAAVEGRPPFDRSDAMAVLAAVMTQRPTEPRKAGPLAPVLAGLLTKDPVERMTAADAEEALASVARGQHVPAPRTAASPVVSPPPSGTPIASIPVPVPVPTPDLTEVAIGGPPTYPATPGGGGKARKVFIPLAAAVLIAGVAVGVFVALNNKGDDKPGPGPASSSPVAGGKTTDGAGTSTDGSRPTPPASPVTAPGMARTVRDGATLQVPAGWRTYKRKQAFFWSEGTSGIPYVQFDLTPWGGEPREHALEWENTVVAKNDLKGYNRIGGPSPAAVPGAKAVDLEYTFQTSGGTMRAVNRGILTADGRHYALAFVAPASRWNQYRDTVKNVLGGFRP
ncbi:protein kinase [Actinomadura barringtoniae]|uniref:non-specific serine/threonine protein kinase n=1 Tax=Actinomadura barringtoniae TaxID=1427535 RepID=A0A939PGV7_9ACTN|nr:serine/threonine-protein kinase [Actinomadura barringtoniae]MBO2448276.1 protein kinase [Actinomadura barringtoniae]